MRRSVSLMLLMAVIACESDAKRLERLQLTAALENLRVLKWEQEPVSNPARGDSLRAAELRRDLARRELNRFMAGR